MPVSNRNENSERVELSVVMPCLNEAQTLGQCIQKAKACLASLDVSGEIIVADNGSTDDSVSIASEAGARVVQVATRGYGAALLGGLEAAQGTFVIMGDADDSYDFTALEPFILELRAGFDFVIGDRFAGGVAPNAMPFLHRYFGNPVLSFIGRLFYGTSVRDFHCGLRGFNREKMKALELSCPGMEFASEMVIKASLARYSIAEVPTSLSEDGRDRPPHLRSFRDGWRHLQLLLLYSPRWLFLYPGIIAFLFGIVTMVLLTFTPIRIGQVVFDIHTLLYAAALSVLGLQMIFFGLLTRTVGTSFGRMPDASGVVRLLSHFSLERGIVFGLVAILIGVFWTAGAVLRWGEADFSMLDPSVTMRHTIPAVALLIMGFQTIMSSFFLGALEVYKR